MSKTVMAKYGELFLKSESVQRFYTKLLTKNIRGILDAEGIDAGIVLHRGRILIGDSAKGDDVNAIAAAVSRVYGIVGLSVAEMTGNDPESLGNAAAELSKGKLKSGMSFAVRARRSNIKEFTSQELGAAVGDRVYDTAEGLRVDLTNPDYEVFVEARREGGLVYDEVIEGPGGLPLGTQGRVVSLLSAGIDSPVAAWLIMKRGTVVTHIHFNGGEHMGADTRKGALANLCALSRWTSGHNHDMYEVNLAPFYDELIKLKNVKNRCIICKRFMLRCSCEIVRRYGYDGIVMGNNLGQVASQTIVNMGVIGAAVPSGIPLLQPLLTYDKEETVRIGRRIGTFRDNVGDVGCRVVPKHPAISAALSEVIADEKELDLDGLCELCLKSTVKYRAVNGELTLSNVKAHEFKDGDED